MSIYIVWLACNLVLQFSASYHKYNFRLGILHLIAIQRGISYSAIKVFNKLPLNITQFQLQFKTALHLLFVDEFLHCGNVILSFLC